MPNDEDTVMGEEAARILGVTRQHLALLARKGIIGQRVLDRYWVFNRAELEAYKAAPKSKGGRPKEAAGTHAPAIPA